MRLAAVHVRTSLLELVRYPSFSLSALVFPATLYLVFLHAYAQPADTRMAGFAGVAILGVVFFQFGVGIAADRVSNWELFVRTLPVGARLRIASRVCAALVFATVAVGAVIVVAVVATPVALALPRWPLLAATLLLGAVPFGLLGIAIGYLARLRAALPLANLLYLPLSFAGGLWSGPTAGASHLLDAVPTRAWASLLWSAVGAQAFDPVGLLLLAAWTAALGAVAVWAYRRDEGERFS